MALLGYISAELLLPRWLMVFGSFARDIFRPALAYLLLEYVMLALRRERVLLLGNSSMLAETTEHVRSRPELGYNILGYLCEEGPVDFPVPCLGRVCDLEGVCDELQANSHRSRNGGAAQPACQ